MVKRKKSGQFVQNDTHTKVWVTLEAEESTFIVFRESSKGIISVTEPTNKMLTAEYRLNDENNLVLDASENGIYETTTSLGKKIKTTVSGIPKPIELAGAWNVEFLKEHDYAATHIFKTLSDWKNNAVDDIQHYSGTAIYTKSFVFDRSELSKDKRYLLQLGDVKIVAEVEIKRKTSRC